jgi:hypothetical protein
MNTQTSLFSRRFGEWGRRSLKGALVSVKLIVLLALLAPAAAGAAPQNGVPAASDVPAAWDIEVVDGPVYFTMMTDRYLRFNASNDPCMAYGGDHLFYSCWNDATDSWQTEVVDFGYMVGSHASLAFNNYYQPFISYFDAYNGDLKMAYKIGGIWQYKVIDQSVLHLQNPDGVKPYMSDAESPVGTLLEFIPPESVTALQPELAPSLPDFTEYPKGYGKYTSIAIDDYGYVHISYYDDHEELVDPNGKGRLKYAFWDGIGEAQVDIVDEYHDQGDVGLWTSIDIDSQNHPHIAYMSEKYDDLKYARGHLGVWETFTIDGSHNVGPSASMILDPFDLPHFSYMDFSNYSLRYARLNSNNSITKVTVDNSSAVGMYSSIGFDSTGRIHISYYDLIYGDLKFARSKSNGWDIVTVGTAGNIGMFTSLVVKGGNPHIAYFNASTGRMEYVFFNGVYWERNILPEYSAGDVGVSTSLAINGWGIPYISYGDEFKHRQKYAHAVGSSWHLEYLRSDIRAGDFSSIALRHDFQPVIAFYDYTHGDLIYAVWDGMEWIYDQVDFVGDVGKYVSLALDSNNSPHISYYDASHSDLRYAYWNNTRWVTETLDDNGFVGLFTSMELDDNDRPYISYFDASNEAIKLAYKSPINAWVFETVALVGVPADGIQVTEAYNSLELDLSNPGDPRAHISYYNDTFTDLMYTYFDGANWQDETVDGGGIVGDDVGKFNSLALDPATQDRHICYYDETNGDLMYAYWNGAWTLETVDSLGDVGMFCSIAQGPAGLVGISYYDNSLGDLKYATNIAFDPPALLFLPLVVQP